MLMCTAHYKIRGRRKNQILSLYLHVFINFLFSLSSSSNLATYLQAHKTLLSTHTPSSTNTEPMDQCFQNKLSRRSQVGIVLQTFFLKLDHPGTIEVLSGPHPKYQWSMHALLWISQAHEFLKQFSLTPKGPRVFFSKLPPNSPF
jgi:hypothetical protein